MLQQDEVLKLAKQAQVHEELCGEYFIYGFAKLVALRYEKKIADLENIICQRHWDVLQEREACAKIVEVSDDLQDWEIICGSEGRGLLNEMAEAIRARGETTLRGTEA